MSGPACVLGPGLHGGLPGRRGPPEPMSGRHLWALGEFRVVHNTSGFAFPGCSQGLKILYLPNAGWRLSRVLEAGLGQVFPFSSAHSEPWKDWGELRTASAYQTDRAQHLVGEAVPCVGSPGGAPPPPSYAASFDLPQHSL